VVKALPFTKFRRDILKRFMMCILYLFSLGMLRR